MRIRVEALQQFVIVHAGTGPAIARDPGELLARLVEACAGPPPSDSRAGVPIDVQEIGGGLLVCVGRDRIAIPEGDSDAAALLWRHVSEFRSITDTVSQIADGPGEDDDVVDCGVGPFRVRATRGQVRAGKSAVGRLLGGLRAVSFSAEDQARLDNLTRRKGGGGS